MRKNANLNQNWQTSVPGGQKTCALPLKEAGEKNGTLTLTHALYVDRDELNTVYVLELTDLAAGAELLLDGEEIGTVEPGFAPSRFDLSENIVKGRRQELAIVLHEKDGAFTLGEARLISTAASHFLLSVVHGSLRIRPVFTEDGVLLRVKAKVVNPNNYDVVIFRLFSPEGLLLDTATAKPTEAEAAFRLADPVLWEGGHANHAYRLEAVLQRDNDALDSVSALYGLRNAKFDADGFFTLNGLKLPLFGAALRDVSHISDAIDALSELEANVLLVPALDPAGRLLRLCDEAGILLALRFPCTGGEEDFRRLETCLPLLDRHPCAAFLVYDSQDLAYAKRFTDTVKEYSCGIFTVGTTALPGEDRLTDVAPDLLLLCARPDPEPAGFDRLAQAFKACCEEHPDYRFFAFADAPECIFERHSSRATRPDCSQEYFSLWHEKVFSVFGRSKSVPAYFAGWLTDRTPESGREGLTTFDTQLKKDAFWFYKAQMTVGGFARLASLPSATTEKRVDVKCFSNGNDLTLSVNGKVKKRLRAERVSESVYVFRGVKLKRKNNTLVLKSASDTDSAVIFRSKSKLEKK